jgi:hypothetical protein
MPDTSLPSLGDPDSALEWCGFYRTVGLPARIRAGFFVEFRCDDELTTVTLPAPLARMMAPNFPDVPTLARRIPGRHWSSWRFFAHRDTWPDSGRIAELARIGVVIQGSGVPVLLPTTRRRGAAEVCWWERWPWPYRLRRTTALSELVDAAALIADVVPRRRLAAGERRLRPVPTALGCTHR